eukprot:GHVP01014204.1.p1 GENE.GHVP01014204.1~~GHVP01014204.1.p1  ORF type:complete len:187 (+),score=30.88 GHVP01014204.1:679-1239(+)
MWKVAVEIPDYLHLCGTKLHRRFLSPKNPTDSGTWNRALAAVVAYQVLLAWMEGRVAVMAFLIGTLDIRHLTETCTLLAMACVRCLLWACAVGVVSCESAEAMPAVRGGLLWVTGITLGSLCYTALFGARLLVHQSSRFTVVAIFETLSVAFYTLPLQVLRKLEAIFQEKTGFDLLEEEEIETGEL